MTKENLIKVGKAISVSILSLIVYSCMAHKTPINKEVIYSVVFGDRFNNDKMDLSINGIGIFENVYLISDKSDGVTTKWVRVYQNNKYFHISSSEYKGLKKVNLPPNKIQLEISYNGRIEEFELKRENGMYIVISDDGYGNLILNQSVHKPVFD